MANDIRNELRSLLGQAAKALNLSFLVENISLEHPTDLNFGDYSSNFALKFGPANGLSAKDLALKMKEELLKLKNEKIDRVEVAGPGFLNFYLSREFFVKQIGFILDQGDNFGRGDKKDQKVLVEYSSPNIAKPFSIGHLRSTIIGDAVANILSFSGFEVIRDNHLGDWGTQFGKQMVAIKKWGDINQIGKSENPVKELVSLYVKFHDEAEKNPELEEEARAEFLKLEKGDSSAKELWQSCVNLSLFEFNKIYQQLGITFDTTLGESTYIPKVSRVYQELTDKGLMKESEGAEVVFFADEKKLPPMIVRKGDGTSIYATRDLGADLERKEKYGDNLIIVNEVGSEQETYMRQLYETEKMLGWFKDGQRVHVSHGLYRFLDGKMSTRKGNVIWLEDVIAEAVTRAGKFNLETASDIGIGALKYNDLKRDSRANIVFDWDETLNLSGNSGPYLQYAFARTQSILAKAEKEGIKSNLSRPEDEMTTVEKLLYRFPEVVEYACLEYAPHHIATYLYELASAFSFYYIEHQVVSLEASSPYRVGLTRAVGQVLRNGLVLLGLKPLSKM